ncbi:N4-gp56 family major capsid protein, partial [Loigolactobacillus coryniformis]|nr:N4-gp56 family major capsid protein [Loigolactobacillus coryniformis]
VPSGRMPTNAAFIIMHPSCFCSPEQINEAIVHVDPVTFSGTQVNMRFIYDAFVMDTKKDAIYYHKVA